MGEQVFQESYFKCDICGRAIDGYVRLEKVTNRDGELMRYWLCSDCWKRRYESRQILFGEKIEE